MIEASLGSIIAYRKFRVNKDSYIHISDRNRLSNSLVYEQYRHAYRNNFFKRLNCCYIKIFKN
jgi:hypothetical protein